MRTTTVTVTCDHCGCVQPEGVESIQSIRFEVKPWTGPYSFSGGLLLDYDLCEKCYDILLEKARSFSVCEVEK